MSYQATSLSNPMVQHKDLELHNKIKRKSLECSSNKWDPVEEVKRQMHAISYLAI